MDEVHVTSLRDGSDGGADDINGQLEELYRLPPTEIQNIDEWQKDEHILAEPPPDYSDDDDDDEVTQQKEDHHHHHHQEEEEEEDYAVLRNHVKSRLSALLTQEEWERILVAEDGGGASDDGGAPSPDYDDLAAAAAAGEQLEPRKLHNPVLESRERQQLHREMLMNKKMGVDVLAQKSELTKEIQRRRDTQKKKELEEYNRATKTCFQQKLEEQANKLKMVEAEKMKTITTEDSQPEFLRVHSKIIRAHQH